jgi:hypothetical protein
MIERTYAVVLAMLAGLAAGSAQAANDLFQKDDANPRNGFLVATDPTYVKECGACHFAYSPGLLPARSWELHLNRMEKHFGESIVLPEPARDAIRRYLVENASDRSDYAGSQVFMERLDAKVTPYRLMDVPTFRQAHRIILEVISIKSKVKVRTLTNCNACHQYAPEGSFGNRELFVPGLTPMPGARLGH